MKELKREKKRILVVDDEKETLDMLGEKLSLAGYEIFTSPADNNVVSKAKDVLPDVILMDGLNAGSGDVCMKAKLDEDSSFSGVPVIYLTGKESIAKGLNCFSGGIDDYLTKPFHHEDLLARVSSALSRREFYEKISMVDGLTGLHNLYFLKKELRHMFTVAKRYKHIFSLALIDVNNLDGINRTYGRAVGDMVLKNIGTIIKKLTREADIVTRRGADEFAVLFTGIGRNEVPMAVKRIKDKINGKSIFIETRNVEIWPSVSVGASSYNDLFIGEDEMLKEAEAGLKEDKGVRRRKTAKA